MSDHADSPMIASASPDGFSPGRILSNARKARGLSIEDVAQALKLAPRQVEAIEVDAFDQLRGLTFARGFVRNYARYLGVDPAPLLDVIVPSANLRPAELVPISNARGDMPSASSPLRTLLPAGITLVALIALALAGWYFDWFRVPAASMTAAPEKIESVSPSQKTESASPSQKIEGVSPSPLREERMMSVPVSTAESVNAPSPTANIAPATASPSVANVAAPVSPPAELATAAAPASGNQRLAFAFDQDSWVEIRDGQGKIVHSQLHKAGTSDDVEVGGKPPYSLVIGNAAKVKLRFNDQPVDLTPFIKVTVARLSLQ